MKKNWFYLFLLIAIAAMPLTSCDEDEPIVEVDQHDPDSDADMVDMTGYDALEWLQSCIAVVNENGEVLRRVYGKPLDESQPTVISVPVKDLAEAETIFLGWVAPDKEATKVDGGYDYALTDAEGTAQGSVSFRAVEGESGVFARMSVAEGTALKQVSEVKFIDAELWPENARYPIYHKGHVYELEATRFDWEYSFYLEEYVPNMYKQKELFYCIQGYGPNSLEAILVWLSPDYNIEFTSVPAYAYIDSKVSEHLPSVVEAEKVLKLFNNNEGSWNEMLNYMDNLGYQWSSRNGGYTTGNDEFLLNSLSDDFFWGKQIKCLDLDSRPGSIRKVKANTLFKYRYMEIRIIPIPRI